MQDLLPIRSCFYSGKKPMGSSSTDHPNSASKKVGQRAVMSAYRTKMDGHERTVSVTWCRSILGTRGLSVSVEPGSDGGDGTQRQYSCRVEMRPWSFWQRQGSKRLQVEEGPAGIMCRPVDVFWDLRNAKYSEEEAEPASEYYVAVVYADEVVLLLGNLNKDAFLRTGSRPSIFDAVLVSKKEHVFGRKRFSTRAKLDDSKMLHAIVISIVGSTDMVIEIDGDAGVKVKHLHWKFRGNDSISVSDKVKVEVYWDVHDWLFSPAGLTHALFIFKPLVVPPPPSPSSGIGSSLCSGGDGHGPSDFCLFLYAWKLE